MILGRKGVKYGLQQTTSKSKASTKPIAAFADDSDDDGNDIETEIAAQAQRKASDKKVAAMQAAALNEDPSIFDYDGVYDSMQEARAQPKQQAKQNRESRYIAMLKDKAVERKREQDIRYERVLAKEREAEEHLFGDKEKFVTAAYRKKLEEDKLWHEEEKRRQAKEAAEDVVKQGHMGNFYRNLLSNNVAFGTAKEKRVKHSKAEASGREFEQGAAVHSAIGHMEGTEEQHTSSVDLAEVAAQAGSRQVQSSVIPSPADNQRGETWSTMEDASQTTKRDGPGLPSEGTEGSRERGVEGQAGAAGQDNTNTTSGSKPAGIRRNDEYRIAAARERYLARKRKAADSNAS